MAIGVVDSDEFESEFGKIPTTKNPTDTVIVKDSPIKGRGTEVPDSLRKVIGETSVIDGRQPAIQLAESFGISKSSVSAYANGATSTSTYNDSKSSIRDHINRTKERISKKARNKLNLALGHITPEKLEAAKVKDVSGVARDMAAIIKDMTPDVGPEKNPNVPVFVFYSPQIKKEDDFETIIVNE